MAFFVNFVIVYMKMIICLIPWLPWSRTQANHKGEVSIYIFFFFFFLVMSVVQNVTWKKSTIVSMEWSQSLFIETGWPVYFRPNHANLVQVLCQEPRTIFCHQGIPSHREKPWLLEELYLDCVSAPERLKFLGVPAFLCWMLVNVDQCGCSDNPGHKFGRIQNKIIIIGQNLKNHFPIRIFQWNLAQSRRTWIDSHYWNNN